MIELLDSENADRDISSFVTCLTHTPDTNEATRCRGIVYLGDGSKNLDGTGGSFKTRVNIGSQQSIETTHVLTAANVRAFLDTGEFVVPANTAVTIDVYSPNGGDSDVDVTAYLYDLDPLAVTPDADSLTTLATTVRGWILQTWRRFFKASELDKDNNTLKTFKDNGTTVVTTQAIAETTSIQTLGGAT